MICNISAIDNPDHWRGRAEEMRVIAEMMHHDETRLTMLRLANDYEGLAVSAERRIEVEAQRAKIKGNT